METSSSHYLKKHEGSTIKPALLKKGYILEARPGKYSWQKIEVRAHQKLHLLGLSDNAPKPASILSGGQQKHVAIAQVLINAPLIIIGDKPTSNRDSKILTSFLMNLNNSSLNLSKWSLLLRMTMSLLLRMIMFLLQNQTGIFYK